MGGSQFCDEMRNRLIRYPGAIGIRLRIARLRFLGVKIGRSCWIRRIKIPRNPWDVVIQDRVCLDDGVILLSSGVRQSDPRLVIGESTYVNRFTMFDASERIQVGANCLIGPFCYVTDHDHGNGSSMPRADQPLVSCPVSIGSNVWIGAGAIVLKGITIGDHAVIAAGAVVTHNVPAGERVAGVPARKIR